MRDVSGANIGCELEGAGGGGRARRYGDIVLQVPDLDVAEDAATGAWTKRRRMRSWSRVGGFRTPINITTQEDADKQVITKVYIVDELVMAPTVRQAPSLSLGTLYDDHDYFGQWRRRCRLNGGGMNGGGNSGSNGSSGGGIFGNSSNTSNQTQQPQKTSQQRGDDLVTLIKEVVRPTIWRDNGGTASIGYFDGKLIVTARWISGAGGD